jgi:hypothetical protein
MSAVVTDVPVLNDWDFGDFPYGLEPLTLPRTDALSRGVPVSGLHVPEPEFAQVEQADIEQAQGQVRDLLTGATRAESEPAQSLEELFWFRWITGHQVTFTVWQLMAAAIETHKSDEPSHEAAIRALNHYARGYCGMLIYTASCPKEVYDELIRPSMFLQHKQFSGTWAPDYTLVRDVFRGKKLKWADPEDAGALKEVVRTYQLIHGGVAARLVPSGRSLLQESHSTTEKRSGLQELVYDNYFLTFRSPTTVHDVVAQLGRRLNAVAHDLRVNGLHPAGTSGESELPEELQQPSVLAVERDLQEIVQQVGDEAVGFSALRPERWQGMY